MSKKNKDPGSYLRFFHISCFLPSIDCYIDEKKHASNTLYEDFTHYKYYAPGEHTLSITLHGSEEILDEKVIALSPYKIYTLLILTNPKQNDKLLLYLIEDVSRSLPTSHCMCRLGHFNYATSLLDLKFMDSEKNETYKRVSCYEMTPYFPLKPQSYNLTLLENLTQKPFLNLKNLTLKQDRFYTFYIIGNKKKETPPQIILSIDGNSYLHFTKPDD